jgi:hypothetical protein
MKKMRKILGAMAAVAAAGALASFAIAGIGDGSQTYRASVDPARVAGARAQLRVEDDRATLVADGLPQPVGAYQAWIMPKGSESPQPSVQFLPRQGSATVAVPGAEDAAAVLVTREARDGSDTPSERPVLTIDMSSEARIVGGQKWLYDLAPATSKIEFPAAADEQRNQFIASFPGESARPQASSVEPAGGSSQAVLGTVPGELWLTETGGLVG